MPEIDTRIRSGASKKRPERKDKFPVDFREGQSFVILAWNKKRGISVKKGQE
jgi:hypothetical protein